MTEGQFQDMILIEGDVEPSEPGACQYAGRRCGKGDLCIEDGVFVVEKGTPLMQLSNPSATLGYLNQETAISRADQQPEKPEITRIGKRPKKSWMNHLSIQ